MRSQEGERLVLFAAYAGLSVSPIRHRASSGSLQNLAARSSEVVRSGDGIRDRQRHATHPVAPVTASPRTKRRVLLVPAKREEDRVICA